MRRYTVAIDGQPFTVDVAETASDAFEVEVDGRRYVATLTGEGELPGVAIAPAVEPWTAEARPATGNGATAPQAPPTTLPAVPAADPIAPLRLPARPGTGLLAAPMPGAIVQVLVAPGATVRRGDSLLVLEAMKMRNAIRAPRDAIVAEVLIEPGAQVASGDPLVRFGPPPA